MTYLEWRRDLEFRERQFLLEREGPPRRSPELRFGLNPEDYAFIARIEKAFDDPTV